MVEAAAEVEAAEVEAAVRAAVAAEDPEAAAVRAAAGPLRSRGSRCRQAVAG